VLVVLAIVELCPLDTEAPAREVDAGVLGSMVGGESDGVRMLLECSSYILVARILRIDGEVCGETGSEADSVGGEGCDTEEETRAVLGRSGGAGPGRTGARAGARAADFGRVGLPRVCVDGAV
jgi:hypothetical protein